MKFIYCYDDNTKERMMLNGYEFISEVQFKGKTAFLFVNNSNKLKFTNEDKVEFSNKMYF